MGQYNLLRTKDRLPTIPFDECIYTRKTKLEDLECGEYMKVPGGDDRAVYNASRAKAERLMKRDGTKGLMISHRTPRNGVPHAYCVAGPLGE